MNAFQAVKESVTAYDVATMAGLRPNRSKMICCPFHADRYPSMKVDVRYYCFGCGARGDAIDFAANYYGIGMKDAAEKLAEEFERISARVDRLGGFIYSTLAVDATNEKADAAMDQLMMAMTALQNTLLKRMRPRRGVRSSVTVMNRKFIAHMTI